MNIDTKYSLDWIKNKYDQGDEMKFIADPHAWRGPNLLGFALMEARDYLRAQIS